MHKRSPFDKLLYHHPLYLQAELQYFPHHVQRHDPVFTSASNIFIHRKVT